MASNLPPGCTDSMIPGNRPEDEAWERLFEIIGKESGDYGMTDSDALCAWKLGFAAWTQAHNEGTRSTLTK